jgi:predicted enzyme related to lactoylglutathione lyase
MGNAVVHFEIGAAQDEPLVKFYGELFGWGLRTIPGVNYTLVDTQGGGGINGGIGRSRTGHPWSTFYVQVDDVQAALDKAASLGARTVLPVHELPGMATFAMFDDPDGLLVGLVKAEEPRDGAPQGPAPGEGAPVDWFEVLGADGERSKAFYAELFGWKVGQGGYGMVDTGAGQGIQGGIGAGGDARWATIYASVPDVERALARAEELGATRVYGPNEVDDHMQTGAFRDPAGNVFGVYHHVPH